MTFSIPDDLSPEVYPLAWLVGRWRGEGVVSYPGIDERPFTQDVTFSHDGGPYLAYTATIRLVVVPDDAADLDGADAHEAVPGSTLPLGPVWATEQGFWRISPERPVDLDPDKYPLEVLLSDPAGHLTLYIGAVGKGRIDLASDLIARTATAADVSAAVRLYGLVQNDLMWAWDLAAFGHPLQSYASARLVRITEETAEPAPTRRASAEHPEDDS